MSVLAAAVYVGSVVEKPQVNPVAQKTPFGFPAPKSVFCKRVITLPPTQGKDINGTVPVVGVVVLSKICNHLILAFLFNTQPAII
jgi:hypothetical protein